MAETTANPAGASNQPPSGAPAGARTVTTRATREGDTRASAAGIEVGSWNGLPNYRCPKCTYALAGGETELDRVIEYGTLCQIPGCPIHTAVEGA